jgi:hypothetical protein
MIMERGARPDVLPKPKRSKTALIGLVGVGVGLALALGLARWAQTSTHDLKEPGQLRGSHG